MSTGVTFNGFTRWAMSMISLTATAGAGALSNPLLGVQSIGRRTLDSKDSVPVVDERAMEISTVWACVSMISSGMATLPLGVYYKDDQDNRQKAPDDSYLSQLLVKRPNGQMNAKEFRMAMVLQRVLWGNAYAIIDRGASTGKPRAIVPIHPACVVTKRTTAGVEYKYQHPLGDKTFINEAGKPAEIFHWRGLTVDGVAGLSPLAYARNAMGLTVATERNAMKAFTGRPMGVMQSDKEFTSSQAKQIRELYDKVEGSAIGDGKWWLIPPGFKYNAIGIPPDDLQMLQSRQFQVAELCRFYGVPTALVDGNTVGAGAWPASYEQQVLKFLTFTLKPYLEEFEEKVSECLVVPGKPKYYVEHNVEGLLRADSQARAHYWSTMVQNGIMTRNEVRKKENLEPLDGLDEATIQVNLTPAQNLGTVPAANPNGASNGNQS